MNFPFITYKAHFENFGSNFSVLEHELPVSLNEEERQLLLEGGLPNEGLPFFCFDLHLKFMRDIFIDNCLMPLGTCISPESHYYIYLGEDHQIYTINEEGHVQFVNSSLRALMQSIFQYSLWLEEIEHVVERVGEYEICNEDIFELYYALRAIDADALKPGHLWRDLMFSNILLQIAEGQA
jgi:hypothetical protein